MTDKMRENNFTVSAMHGDMPQKEREAIMGRAWPLLSVYMTPV